MAATIIAVLTSCSSNADSSAPTKLPPTNSVSPTPVRPPTPESEVEAAVRTYFKVANEAVKSGDTRRLITLSGPSCPCRALVQDIETVYANGRADTAGFDVRSVIVQEIQGDTAAAEVQYVVPAYTVLDLEGRITESVPTYEGHDYNSLVKSGGSWLLENTFNMNASAVSH